MKHPVHTLLYLHAKIRIIQSFIINSQIHQILVWINSQLKKIESYQLYFLYNFLLVVFYYSIICTNHTFYSKHISILYLYLLYLINWNNLFTIQKKVQNFINGFNHSSYIDMCITYLYSCTTILTHSCLLLEYMWQTCVFQAGFKVIWCVLHIYSVIVNHSFLMHFCGVYLGTYVSYMNIQINIENAV